jgi:hypothetical protein
LVHVRVDALPRLDCVIADALQSPVGHPLNFLGQDWPAEVMSDRDGCKLLSPRRSWSEAVGQEPNSSVRLAAGDGDRGPSSFSSC